MIYSDEILKKVEICGKLNYTVKKTCNVVSPENIDQFKEDLRTPGSVVYEAYKKGSDVADFLIDSKLMEEAEKGTISAIQLLDTMKRNRRLQNVKDEIINED